LSLFKGKSFVEKKLTAIKIGDWGKRGGNCFCAFSTLGFIDHPAELLLALGVFFKCRFNPVCVGFFGVFLKLFHQFTCHFSTTFLFYK
jgi:hypothetical protein